VFQSPVDLSASRRVLYLSHSKGTLVAVGSDDQYHVLAFDAASGATKWHKHFAWKQDHHGGAISHPTIVGDTIYVEHQAFALADGSARRGLPPRGHGCGAQSASLSNFFYRGGYHTSWDIRTNVQTTLAPARSGCWLGLIPAGGVLLAPETSSGCSCTHALQTSMAFVPREKPANAPARP
jgi:hypothetical protein